jgi:anthranilate phosphoribosyltransferase
MDIQSAIRHVTEKDNLSRSDMRTVMNSIMTGQCSPAQIAGFLIGLRMKGETIDEITAAAEVMREIATPVKVRQNYLIDTCGTGGDGVNTFNISTTAAFVVAAAGACVAKHGNRSVSSRSGSADVLEAAGVKLDLSADQVAECINRIGIGFMFAPLHHSAMKHAIGPRKELGVRTIFNVLGPLTNPAGTPNQVLGVFSDKWLEPLARVLQLLDSEHVMVVHAEDGMDEISLSAPTKVTELIDDEIKNYTLTPEQFGIKPATLDTLAVNSIDDSLIKMKSVLDGEESPAKDIISLNAGAAIYTAGITDNLESGINKAQQTIESGDAKSKFEALIKLSNEL